MSNKVRAYNILAAPLLLLTIALLHSGTGLAGEWTGGIEGGSVARDGTNATRIRLWASLDDRPLSHRLDAEWYRSDTDTVELGYRPRYWITDRFYAFGDGHLRFARRLGIDQETLLLAGAGTQLLSTETQSAWLEVGGGYRLIDYTTATGLEDNDEPVGILRGGASQLLSDQFKLELDGNTYRSTDLVQYQVEAGIAMRVTQGAIKLSYLVRRVEVDGLEAIEDTDTVLAFTVGF